jgi:hypothetical protein
MTIRRLFGVSGNLCAFPGCASPLIEPSGTITGQICHIRARSTGGARYDLKQPERSREFFGNLILLCSQHHKVVDTEPQIYTVELLEEMKANHERQHHRLVRDSDAVYAKLLLKFMEQSQMIENSGNFVLGSPSAEINQSITIKSSAKRLVIQPPIGAIGASLDASRYIQHLINRYNEFASKEPSRAAKFSYGAISKNIESVFHSQWKLLPLENFPSLSEYLHDRISKTRQAKSNRAKGYPSFSSYEEFLEKTTPRE